MHCRCGPTPKKAAYGSRYRAMYTWLYEKREEPGMELGPEILQLLSRYEKEIFVWFLSY